MNAWNKKLDNYNPIKDIELYKEPVSIDNEEEVEILAEKKYNDNEMERKARIERNNYLRAKRKEYYHLRLTLAFIGVGIFSLISGYTISQLKNNVQLNREESVRTDGVIFTQEATSIIYQDWKLRLVNYNNRLVTLTIPELNTLLNGIQVDSRIEEDLSRMISAGKKEAGLDILVVKGYISRLDQIAEYNEAVEAELEKGATYLSAYNIVGKNMQKPGYNERELGLTVYLVGRDYQNLDLKQADTATAIWLSENCSRFGFILRYPQGKEDITGEQYQPWCFRYVGTNVAPIIKESNLTLEEYINTK